MIDRGLCVGIRGWVLFQAFAAVIAGLILLARSLLLVSLLLTLLDDLQEVADSVAVSDGINFSTVFELCVVVDHFEGFLVPNSSIVCRLLD